MEWPQNDNEVAPGFALNRLNVLSTLIEVLIQKLLLYSFGHEMIKTASLRCF